MLNSLFSSRITFSLAYHTALRCYVSRTGTASSCRTTAWCAWTLKDAAPPCSSTAVASSSYHLRGTCSLLPNRATMPMKREFWGWRKFSRFDGKMKSIWVSWCFGMIEFCLKNCIIKVARAMLLSWRMSFARKRTKTCYQLTGYYNTQIDCLWKKINQLGELIKQCKSITYKLFMRIQCVSENPPSPPPT